MPVLETWLLDKKLMASTRMGYITAFKSFTQYLKVNNFILFDIGQRINRIKVPRKHREVLSRDEVKLLLETPDKTTGKGMRDYLILALSYFLGTRAAETAGIRVRHINLEHRSVKIIGKGGHSRILYFPQQVAVELKKYMKDKKQIFLFPEVDSHKVSSLTTRYFASLGFSQQGAHTLRFTISTHMAENGVPLEVINLQLGHKNLSCTLYYVRFSLNYLKNLHQTYHPFQRGFL